MTQYELNFSLLVEQMLSKITDPAYRQMIVEVCHTWNSPFLLFLNCIIMSLRKVSKYVSKYECL